jgi:hypothetical protein
MSSLLFTVLPDTEKQSRLTLASLEQNAPLPGVVGSIIAHGIQNVPLPLYEHDPSPFLPGGLKGVLVSDAKQQLRDSVYAWGESGENAEHALPDNFHSLSLTEKVDRLSTFLVAYHDSPSMSEVLPNVIMETLPQNAMDPARAALYIIPKLAQEAEVKLLSKGLDLDEDTWIRNMDFGADHDLCGIGEYVTLINEGDMSNTELVDDLLDVPAQHGLSAACEGMANAVFICGTTNDGVNVMPQIAMEYEGKGLADTPPRPTRR